MFKQLCEFLQLKKKMLHFKKADGLENPMDTEI